MGTVVLLALCVLGFVLCSFSICLWLLLRTSNCRLSDEEVAVLEHIERVGEWP